ncbi:MAG: hypothetical protein H6738_04605 [Alphaproteobacteria bacterium]|nr:hypothetical protein [Alphaproteobacteria bacterium]MCB9696054.1 hypothetical protein [Alphaproteobacteria bacterium]
MLTGSLAIARREWVAAFGRPLAWGVLALFVASFGLLTLWYDDLFLSGVASLRGPLSWLAGCLLLVVPATTMRSFAEDQRTGAWQVLHALPVTPTALVVGKWLGALGVCGGAILLTAPWPVALAWVGEPDPGPILGGYLGVGLLASALAAVGIAASAWFDSQVLAYLVALVAGGAPWLVGRALPLVPAPLVPWVERLTAEHHLAELARGVVDPGSFVYFLALAAVALRLAVHRVEHRRLA